ncbi:MAG TPA: hypothetical protein VL524_12360 [Gemmatimonadaceae bacterium]|nr:hypothetical protein [Gemmatimonadaceae bacterium]
MKMLVLVYSGSSPQRISSLLDAHHAGGYTEFRNAHGAGSTGRREGSRAWPGESTLFVSVLPATQSDALVSALRAETTKLPAGERLHVAVLPTETFF